MNKIEFLVSLRKKLRWRITDTEIQRIISDYDNFFVVSLNKGKNESQTCEELGDITLLANKILANSTAECRTIAFLYGTHVKFLFSSALLTLFTLYSLFLLPQISPNLSSAIVSTTIFAIILNIILRSIIPAQSKAKYKQNHFIMISNTLIPFMLIGICMLIYVQIYTVHPNPNIGPIIWSIILSCSIISLFIGLISIWKLIYGYLNSSSTILHVTSILAFFGSINYLLRSLDSTSVFLFYLLMTASSYAIVIIISVVCLYLVSHINKSIKPQL